MATIEPGDDPGAAGPRSCYLRACGRELHYLEWGPAQAPALLMWHGLVRTGRDFDVIAAALAGRYRVLCPDTIGRGLSQWSPAPDEEYCLDFYVRLAEALLDQLGIARVRWLGTSMGGALGVRAAAGVLRARISHLVLNDIGATIEATPGAERITSYVANPPAFATMSEFEQFVRTVYRPYGWQSDAQWRRMAQTSARRLPDGRITAHYDPAVTRQFAVHPDDYRQWHLYDRLEVPTLLLRGEASDLLPIEVAREMTRRGPRARLLEIAGCGHAPALNVPAQIEPIAQFLAQEAA